MGATNAVCEISNGSVLGDSFSALIINVPQGTVLGIQTVKSKLMDRIFLVLLSVGWRMARRLLVCLVIKLTQEATVNIGCTLFV